MVDKQNQNSSLPQHANLGANGDGNSASNQADQEFLVQGWYNASRISWLIDASAYYSALARAFENAERSIVIIGWDFDSRICLEPAMAGSTPCDFLHFLKNLLKRKPNLHVDILCWDYTAVFAPEREPVPELRLKLAVHDRLTFEFDGHHPLLSSHHQKLVLIDGKLGFVGGMDIAADRWDTSEHAATSAYRINPAQESYNPIHDVQVMVEGEIAIGLAEIARARWRNAVTWTPDIPPFEANGSLWPDEIQPDLENVRMGVCRTEPEFDGLPEVREIESCYVEAIHKAKHHIYIENQYFTSEAVYTAIAERIHSPEGPEVVLVLPNNFSGKIEEHTFGLLRNELLARLREQDIFHKMRVFYPVVPGMKAHQYIKVHSKLMIVDHEILLVGSANLSNRSMGLDTELDLLIATENNPRVKKQLFDLEARLLAEHLGSRVEEVRASRAETGSLLRTIAALNDGPRTLRPIPTLLPKWNELAKPLACVLDADASLEPERLLNPEYRQTRITPALRFGLVLALLLLAVVLWHWSPLGETFSDPDALLRFLHSVQHNPYAVPIAIATTAIGTLAFVPVNLMSWAIAFVLPKGDAFMALLVGTMISLVVGYFIGQLAGSGIIFKLFGHRLEQFREHPLIKKSGFLAVATLRLLPLAPFNVVNAAMGACRIRFRDYFWGSLLANLPGKILIVFFADSLRGILSQPRESGLLLAGGLFFAVCAFLVFLVRRTWKRKRHSRVSLSFSLPRAEGENH